MCVRGEEESWRRRVGGGGGGGGGEERIAPPGLTFSLCVSFRPLFLLSSLSLNFLFFLPPP